MLSIFFFYGGMGILALRIALALIFLVHGWQKIKSLKQTAAAFDGMGFKPGFFWGTIVALLEFAGGGIGLLLGIFTPTIAALLALQFVTIVVWKLVKRQPFVGGWEFDLLILAALLVLALNGAGAYSLDRLFLFGL
ncbi:MAG: DoxX family protein [Minisyncoccia bacterium]|jgi:putative oxidoreductase